jgi:hypothetical protein
MADCTAFEDPLAGIHRWVRSRLLQLCDLSPERGSLDRARVEHWLDVQLTYLDVQSRPVWADGPLAAWHAVSAEPWQARSSRFCFDIGFALDQRLRAGQLVSFIMFFINATFRKRANKKPKRLEDIGMSDTVYGRIFGVILAAILVLGLALTAMTVAVP